MAGSVFAGTSRTGLRSRALDFHRSTSFTPNIDSLSILLSWYIRKDMHYLRTRALFAFGLMRGWHVGMWNYEDMKSRTSTPTFGIWRGSGAELVSCPNCGLRYTFLSVGGSGVNVDYQQILVSTDSLFLTIVPYTSALCKHPIFMGSSS